MKYKVYKLKFNTAVHIGKGRLEDAESTFMADTIFSALCCEAAADGKEAVERLADMVRTDSLVISDAMPYHNDKLYIVKPYLSPENTDESNSAEKKQAKKLKYIEADRIDEYLKGNLDISAANSELDEMGKKEIRTMVSVSDIEETKPYSVGACRFNEGWGLYIIIGYETEEVLDFTDNLIRSLSYSGIGGKRSAGLGRFDFECGEVPENLKKGLSGDGDFTNYILLSSAMAPEEQLSEVLDGARYMLEKRSGFVYSDTYADTNCKKNDIFLFKAGSVFKNTFTGILADVSVAGNHPVYRYAKPVFVGGEVMKEFLKRYKVEIETIGPVHIGSGETIKKKEWLLDNRNHKAVIADTGKLFAFLKKNKLLDEFEKFFLGDSGNLQIWLKEHGIFEKDYREFEKYTLDISGIDNIRAARDIALCTKDAYGMPYIPGSSLKGAIRTAILAKKIKETGYHDPEIKDQIYSYKGNRKRFLSNQSRKLNQEIFYTGDFDQKNPKNIVNDIMKGIRVSDSKPLDCGALTLCQKVDVNTKGKETNLPILRECIRPGCIISTELTIDTGITDISCEYIRQAIQEFLADYNKMFLKYFTSETLFEGNVIYLGGGVGFASKTVANQLLAGEPNRVRYIGEIIDKTTKGQHSGNKAVNPHIVKLTEYDRDLIQMGACSIEFAPV